MEGRVIVLLLIMVVLNKTTGQNCTQFLLTEQPPSTLNCNPFHTSNTEYIWKLRSSCTVENIGNTQSFKLHWFHRNNNSEVIDLGVPEYHATRNSTKRVLFGMNFNNQAYNSSMVGDYWCQVVVFNEQDHTYYGSGNIITIHPPDYYNNQLDECSGIITDKSTVCIDKPYSTTSTVTSMNKASSSQHITVVMVTSTKPVSTFSETTPSISINPFTTPLATVSFQANNSPELSEASSSIGIITGTVVAILMLVTACVLLVCMIVIIAISIRKNKLVALERIPINNMKSVIDPSLMDNNPAYRKVTIGQAIEESDHNKGNATTSLNTSAAMAQSPPPKSPIYVNDRTVQWKNEPIYENTDIKKGRSTISNFNGSRVNEQPHYENMELLKSSSRSQSGRYESQSTNQNPVTSGNSYYQNVSMMTNHHHYYNTGILRRQNDRVNTTTDHDYANLSPTNKQPSLATEPMETDLAEEYKERHDEANTGSTATLTMNEVL